MAKNKKNELLYNNNLYKDINLIKKRYPHQINIEYLKKYSFMYNLNEDKDDIDFWIKHLNNYYFSTVINYLKNKNTYEVCCTITHNKKVAGGLLYREFNNKLFASIYFKYLKYILLHMKTSKLVKKIENHK